MRFPKLHLRDLFWLVLVIAIGLGGYRWGTGVGFEAGRKELDRSKTSVRTYPVPFAANHSAELIGWIKSTVNRDGWSLDGTTGTGQSVQYFEPGKSLVVSAYGDTHEDVTRLLKTIERLDRQAKSEGKSWLDVMPQNPYLGTGKP